MPNQQQIAAEIRKRCEELSEKARGAGLEMLAHVLDVAALEAIHSGSEEKPYPRLVPPNE